MAGSKAPYILLLALMLAVNLLIFSTPFFAAWGNDGATEAMHAAFSPTCHQLASRSICLFAGPEGYSIGDCTEEGLSLSRAQETDYRGKTGYKFPVCSRDVAIYAAMLLGLLALPFLQRVESEDWPSNLILIAACVPIGIDGFTQLFGLRESTNLLRIATGAIIGVVLPFYIVPIMNSLYKALSGSAASIMAKGKTGKKARRGK